MSGYAIQNIKDLDSTSRPGIDIDARFSRSALGCTQVGVSHWRYGANVRSPVGHRHRVQEEVYVVVSGSGRAKLDDRVVDLKQWDTIRVAPEVARAFEGGPDGLEMIVVGGERPEGGDGELVKDFWPE
jgi:mannose-6-phosphate isomerase-like protein (cupin superfamily)